MSNFRVETDTMGEMKVESDKYWGAQTQRSLINFAVGDDRMPRPVIRALGVLKKAAAEANHELGKLPKDQLDAISAAADEVIVASIDRNGRRF